MPDILFPSGFPDATLPLTGGRYLILNDERVTLDQLTAYALADGSVTNVKLRDSVGVSVIGRSVNSTGDPGDIVASANDRLMARVADVVGFVQLTLGMIPDTLITGAKLVLNTVGNAQLRQGVARSLVGVTGNATANVADIQGTTGGHVARVNDAGTAVSFDTVSTASIAASAVTAAKLAAWPAAKASRAAVQAIPDSATTAIDFDTSVFATGGANAPVVSLASNHIQIILAGLYRVTGHVSIQAFGAGLEARVLSNGSPIMSFQADNTNAFAPMRMSDVFSLAVNDLLTLTVFQAVQNPTANTGTSYDASTLSVEYVGPIA